MKSLSMIQKGQKYKLNLSRRQFLVVPLLILTGLATLQLLGLSFDLDFAHRPTHFQPLSPQKQLELQKKCAQIHEPAGPGPDLPRRSISDRYVNGTRPVLLRNAKILTGARNGTEIVFGDILLDNGLVSGIGYIPEATVNSFEGTLDVIDLQWRNWVSPGLFDLHSHIGVSSAPYLSGSASTNSHAAPILPWLRSIDGLNTHDDAYLLSISGGVTSAQVLPGSANNIGGQAVLIKLRQPEDKSVQSMLLEPPENLFTNVSAPGDYVRWRHMKHACGENPSRVYSQTRLDSAWKFRSAYEEARKIKLAQDEFCGRFERNGGFVEPSDSFPEDLQWEALVDVLRGKVKLSVHCYEAVDLDTIVRLSNEFKFPIASFHHAGETYLVPELLKQTWGGAPAAALFASNARSKREAYRSSEFAPAILAENGIRVVMKSDHPVLNSRYLLFEAQLAHYYGLNPALALASVTSIPAEVAGVGWRVGKLARGYDADLVIWDSHPLALGATPTQVYIDGISQLESPAILTKPHSFQDQPSAPDWQKEQKEVVEWDGLPPLSPEGRRKHRTLVAKNVKTVWVRDPSTANGLRSMVEDEPLLGIDNSPQLTNWTVVLQDGHILCMTSSYQAACLGSALEQEVPQIDLEGGSILPGLTTFGSPLGLTEINQEPTTGDGSVVDPVTAHKPLDAETIRAVDGLLFGTRDALLSYVRGGVTRAVSAPEGSGFMHGLGTSFSLGARHALEEGAVLQEETALHIRISLQLSSSSVSSQFSALRRILLEPPPNSAWERVQQGLIPLVVEIDSADAIATLLRLKADVEKRVDHTLRLTLTSAVEAHLLAQEIAKAGVSVVLTPPLQYPYSWEARRILPGPPLTPKEPVMTLLEKGVNVGIGLVRKWEARNTRFILGIVALESNGTLSKGDALALVTTNLDTALGLRSTNDNELVLYQGGNVFDLQSKPVGVVKPALGITVLF